jgi:hypothetical protein
VGKDSRRVERGSAGERNVQNEPNFGAGGPPIADWRLRIADWKTPAGMASAQNEDNFGTESCETNLISPGWGRASEGKCAEQTQFGDERIYAKWCCGRQLWRIPVRRASEKQSQFGGVKFAVAGVKSERSGSPSSDFRLLTSDFKLRKKRLTASLRTGLVCKTKPICRRGIRQ